MKMNNEEIIRKTKEWKKERNKGKRKKEGKKDERQEWRKDERWWGKERCMYDEREIRKEETCKEMSKKWRRGTGKRSRRKHRKESKGARGNMGDKDERKIVLWKERNIKEKIWRRKIGTKKINK